MRRSLSLLGKCIFLLAIISDVSIGSEQIRLLVGTGGRDSGWKCDSVLRACYASGRELFWIRITNIETTVHPNLSPGWPKGLTIEAGRMNGETFTPDPELHRQMAITREIEALAFSDDSLAQAQGKMSGLQASLGVRYEFGITIPVESVGQRLYLRTTWDSLGTGRLSELFSIDPILPCNNEARQQAQGTWVEDATVQGFHERAVQLADSLIALGWHDPRGLGWAVLSAKQLHHWADELRLMDLNYKTNGQVSPLRSGSGEEWRRSQADYYQQTRQDLLQKIQNQPQPR
jgi:hypothetical protein